MTDQTAQPSPRGTRLRRMIFAVLTAGTGLLALAASMLIGLDGTSPTRTVHRIHDFGFGLGTAVIAVGLLASALGRGRWPAALQLAAAAGVGFLVVSLLAGVDPGGAIVLVAIAAIAAALHPNRPALFAAGRPSPILGAMALAGSVLLAWYAASQIVLQRAAHASEPHAAEDHYAWMAALAVALAAALALASLRTVGWRIPAWIAAAGLVLFGLASLATPLLSGSLGSPGAIMAVVGGPAFLIAAELDARRSGPVRAAGIVDTDSALSN